jgi:hypothetical protein
MLAMNQLRVLHNSGRGVVEGTVSEDHASMETGGEAASVEDLGPSYLHDEVPQELA